jgi:hypothetical protein
MTTEFKLKAKKDAAQSRWEAVQMQAANAQRELDYAVAVFEKHQDELEQGQIEATQAQIDAQKDQIKEYLMKGYQAFLEAEKAYEYGVGKLNA